MVTRIALIFALSLAPAALADPIGANESALQEQFEGDTLVASADSDDSGWKVTNIVIGEEAAEKPSRVEKRESDGPRHETKLFPVVQHERTDDYSETKVANVIVGEGIHHERRGTRNEVEIIDVPFFTLLESESDEDRSEVNFVKAPFTRVFSSETHGGHQETRVLDVPFFSLVESDKHDNGNVETTFIKLPIVGALFKHKRTGDKEKVRFLIFSHTRDLSDDAEGSKRDSKTKKRPKRWTDR